MKTPLHTFSRFTTGGAMGIHDETPRRSRMDKWTPAEHAIQNAVVVVEEAGAHPLLTDAVILLGQARDKVADYVDAQLVTLPVQPRGEADGNDGALRAHCINLLSALRSMRYGAPEMAAEHWERVTAITGAMEALVRDDA